MSTNPPPRQVPQSVGAFLAGVPLVDAHHHFWQLERFPYRWLAPSAPPARFGDKSAIRRDYLPGTYLDDMAGLQLTASVHVQANCGAADPAEETKWLQDLSGHTGWPTAAVGEVDLTDPDALSAIDRHRSFSILRGIRTPVAWDTEGRWRIAKRPAVLSEASFREAARHLAEHDLCLEMVVVPEQLNEVAQLARALPDLRIVINHFATLEPSRPGNPGLWQDGVCAISTEPNIYLKLSGLWTAAKDWSPTVLAPFVKHALDNLGAARILYGSNMPVEGVNCRVSEQLESLAIILRDRNRGEIEDIFSRTAQKVYRIDPEAR